MVTDNVNEEMTRHAVSVKSTDHLYHAFALMRRLGVRHLPVIDGGDLVGILSDRDIFRKGVIRSDELVVGVKLVVDAMTRGVFTCKTTDRIGDVADLMLKKRIDALPVTNEDGGVVGIITSFDLMRCLRRVEGVQDVGAVIEQKIYALEPED